MPQTRRQFAWSLLAAPAVLAIAAPGRLFAQQRAAFGAEGPPNVFISPCGRPFRAKVGAPYPVTDWFKQADADGDGKIDHKEFVADSLAFFNVLDRNADGVISPQEVNFYEQRIAPEVLGMRVEIDSRDLSSNQPRLWKVQGIPGGMGPGGTGGFRPGGATGPGGSVDPGAGGDQGPDEDRKSRPYDASGAGASPYSFFDEPEPVTAADIHFRGLITKADWVQLADAHFETLDRDGRGFLTLDTLPKTPVQRRLEQGRHRRG